MMETLAPTETVFEKTFTGNAGRILELLGNGLSPEIVATAAGVSPSFISQLLSTEEFATQVTALRFKNLQEDTERDKRYGKLEDQLLTKMEDLLPMMYKPMEILRAITVVNGAKRRGASAPETQHINNTVVNLVMPRTILQQFITNANNQVVEVIDAHHEEKIRPPERKTLVTMPSASLKDLVEGRRKEIGHETYAPLLSNSSAG